MNRNPLILITGANGFVGQSVRNALISDGQNVRCAVRAKSAADQHSIGEIGPTTDWTEAVRDVECVIHLAARTHILKEEKGDILARYLNMNLAATEQLARSAARSGVRRFVFMSSIKVNGESTSETPFSEDSVPAPEDEYGLSKWKAEQALRHVEAATGMEVVILRSPLVYGPGVKGNFLRLMQWVASGIPLPFASITNRRSLIYVGNLADAVVTCAKSPSASGKTYLGCDATDVSTPELIRMLALQLGTKSRLFRCSPQLLEWGAKISGKSREASRLIGSLQIDCSKIRAETGWQSRLSLSEGLHHTARWYLSKFNLKSNI